MNVSTSARLDRAWVEVDLAAVVANARALAERTGVRLVPVVKADAYGLGAVAVARALEAVDPWGYGVATVDEALALRGAGITRPILVFMPPSPAMYSRYHEHRLRPTLVAADDLAAWTAAGGGPYHVEVDTGMGRTGIPWTDAASLARHVAAPDFEGAFMQFHSAERDEVATAEQYRRFEAALGAVGRRPPLVHVANSAGAMYGKTYACDAVRPGLYLYGGSPGGRFAAGRPVVTVRARVVSLRTVPAGETVGYGATWRAIVDTPVATLAIGYADGVPRTYGEVDGAHVIVAGRRCPFIARVTMDLTMVDVTDAPVRVGDVATLVGEVDGARITLDDVARWSREQPRAFLTGLGARLPRLYRS